MLRVFCIILNRESHIELFLVDSGEGKTILENSCHFIVLSFDAGWSAICSGD